MTSGRRRARSASSGWPRLSHPRRHQYRHAIAAALSGLAGAVLLIASVAALTAGRDGVGGGLLVCGCAMARHALRRRGEAKRNRIGADAESRVAQALGQLPRDWQVEHGIRWRGTGDIDHVAITPSGIAVAIETKTRRYDRGDVNALHAKAAWLARNRRCQGAVALLVVMAPPGAATSKDGVRVVGIARLRKTLIAIDRLQRERS